MSDAHMEWERRRPAELTTEYLGRVLDWLELREMAARARLGHFDDWFAPAEVADGMEITRLVNELRQHARRMQVSGQRLRLKRTMAVIAAVKAGEFDATKAEFDRWAASKDGQDTLRALVEGR